MKLKLTSLLSLLSLLIAAAFTVTSAHAVETPAATKRAVPATPSAALGMTTTDKLLRAKKAKADKKTNKDTKAKKSKKVRKDKDAKNIKKVKKMSPSSASVH